MAVKVFQGSEREFLPLTALAQPGWEGLSQLAQEGFDWQSR
jgi:hypothetical protein